MLKTLRIVLGTATSAFLIGAATGQTNPPPSPSATNRTNEAHAQAVDLLRRVLQEQQKNPDRIIRNPGDATQGRETRPTTPVATTPTTPRLGRVELERQFLEGKISAKQYQRAMDDLEKNPPPAVASAKPAPTNGTATTTATTATTAAARSGKTPTPPPSSAVAPSPEDAPEQKALSDVEAKIDEILSRREAQLQAARTNAANTNSVPAGPLTKRQKLDALLRQLIQGKITEPEYNAQREKVLAQPD